MNYQLIYDQLITKYGTWEKPKGVYTERHRKLPGCHGGKYVRGNAFYVPARIHLILHLILAKLYSSDRELVHAAFRMSNQRVYGTKQYAWVKEKWANTIRGEANPAKREEVRKKISDNNPMKIPEIREKAGHWAKSEEGRKFTSDRFSGDKNPSCRPEVKELRRQHVKRMQAIGKMLLTGDKSPARNPETIKKIVGTRKKRKIEADKLGIPYGVIPPEKHPMKKQENKDKAAVSASSQWKNPETREKMITGIKAAHARRKENNHE